MIVPICGQGGGGYVGMGEEDMWTRGRRIYGQGGEDMWTRGGGYVQASYIECCSFSMISKTEVGGGGGGAKEISMDPIIQYCRA